MKKSILIVIPLVIVALCSSSFKPRNEYKMDIIGVWVFDDFETNVIKYNNYITKYVKSNKFKKDDVGIEFKRNGKLIKRQNNNWCGTPPVLYSNYAGTWQFISDSAVTIHYKFWGGKAKEEWKIFEVNNQILKIKSISYSNENK